MRQSSPNAEIAVQGPDGARPAASVAAAPSPIGSSPADQGAADRAHAAQGPMLEAVSAAENPAPIPAAATPVDSPDETRGRRTLSTAFVRLGPDGHLTVELRDGHVLTLRNVVMRRRDYCGVDVHGDAGASQYCGKYGDVVSARPGGLPAPVEPESAAANPIKR